MVIKVKDLYYLEFENIRAGFDLPSIESNKVANFFTQDLGDQSLNLQSAMEPC